MLLRCCSGLSRVQFLVGFIYIPKSLLVCVCVFIVVAARQVGAEGAHLRESSFVVVVVCVYMHLCLCVCVVVCVSFWLLNYFYSLLILAIFFVFVCVYA